MRRPQSSACAGLIAGIVYLLIGVWTNNAASSFRKIVGTRGRDVTNLMDALGNLRSVYSLQRILIIIALVLIPLVMIAAFALQMQERERVRNKYEDLQKQLRERDPQD